MHHPTQGGRDRTVTSLHGLSLAQKSYMVRDRLSWMRFCGLEPGDTVPDAITLWDFREALTAARALEKAFEMLDQIISAAGYLPMGGQIIDATLVAAPKHRNTDGEKVDIMAGEVPEEWKDQPAGLRQSAKRSIESLWSAIGELLQVFKPPECGNYFAAAAYDAD